MPEYTNAQYYCILGTSTIVGIKVDVDDVLSFVPVDPANTDYSNIMQLVESGDLIIKPADEANN
jgi:hypothetical protein